MSSSVGEAAGRKFRDELEGWLREENAKPTLAAIAQAHPAVTPDAVFRRVSRRWPRIEALLRPSLGSWEKAKEDLREAEESVEEQVPKSRLKRTAAITALLTVLLTAVLVWLALNVDLGWVALWFVALIPLLGFLYVWTDRQEAEIKAAVSIRKKELEKARGRFDTALRDQIRIAVREVANSLSVSYRKDFRIFDPSGLKELADREREVPTRSSTGLARLLTSLTSGSIGLAGPRGAGKTTLIDSFARGRSLPLEKERIGLVVSAPVKYDAREFILHLFASLCKRVLGEDSLEEISRLNWQVLARQRKAAISRFLVGGGLLLMAAGGLMLLTRKTAPHGPEETGAFLLGLGAAVVYGALLVWIGNDPNLARNISSFFAKAFSFLEDEEAPRPTSPEQRALEHLEEIQLQQSISSGWSGSLKLPLGMSLGGDSSQTVSRTPWTLPEAVEEFRNFASTEFEGRYVVIGIDELDKMESDEAAREFLNDVKGVFGVRNCYYLVSISEEAMSTFERRGLPFRDVFDSSFDAIERVEFLTLEESRMVLESRVTGLPIPFQCLCHSLSGGLPRDLIRVTRSLVQLGEIAEAEEPFGSDLATLALKLIEDEHRRKAVAAIGGIRPLRGAAKDWLAQWLSAQASTPTSPDRLHRWSSELEGWSGMVERADEDDQMRQAQEIAIETSLFNYYAATVMDLYGSSQVDELVRASIGRNPESPVERLAVARQQFSISARLAWATIDEVRREFGGGPWRFPARSRAGRGGLRR